MCLCLCVSGRERGSECVLERKRASIMNILVKTFQLSIPNELSTLVYGKV